MTKTLIFGGGGMAQAFEGKKISKKECDVRDIKAVMTLIEKEKPKTVIVTAGVSNPTTIGWNDFYKEEIEVNLIGSFNVASASVYFKVKNLIFIASIAGLYGKPNHAGYSASKSGVISLVQSLALEGHNAYAISPGRVDTPMREQDYPGEDPRTRLKPEQINEIVEDILSGQYEPGDNIIIRMRKYKTLPIQVDKNLVWKKKLRIGLPVTV